MRTHDKKRYGHGHKAPRKPSGPAYDFGNPSPPLGEEFCPGVATRRWSDGRIDVTVLVSGVHATASPTPRKGAPR